MNAIFSKAALGAAALSMIGAPCLASEPGPAPASPTAAGLRAEAFDLRLTGARQPAIERAGVPMAREERRNMAGDGPSWTPFILGGLAAAAIGVVMLLATATGGRDRCMDAELCR